MNELLENFHFIRPWWLLAAVPLFLLIHFFIRHKKTQGQWHQLIPNHLAKVLIEDRHLTKKELPKSLMYLLTLIGVIALSGPTWEQVERPLFKVKQAQIIIADMSLSMYSTDIAPNRLTRAKFKIQDLVARFTEGETALIAYAGDAFVISPMTSDVANLTNLIPSLNPQIMPIFGSQPLLAIDKALELFAQTNYKTGSIYLITDGLEPSDARQITQALKNSAFELNILGVGTEQGAPIKLPNEQLLKDDNGNIVIPKLQSATLRGLSRSMGGRYSNMTHDLADLNYLSPLQDQKNQESEAQDNQFGDDWHEIGPYLLLIILPFAAFAFRRGVLTGVAIIFLLPSTPSPLFATTIPVKPAIDVPKDEKSSHASNWWDNLWATKDQLAHKAYQAGDFTQASEKFENTQWQGATHYRQGNYEQALESFNKMSSANATFNQANTLAKLNQFDESIARYKSLLEKYPDYPNAQENLALVEQLAKQNEEQKNQSDNQQQNGKDSNEQEESGEQEKSDQQQESGEDQDSQEQQSGDNGQQKNDQKDGQPSKDQENPSEQEEQTAANNDERQDETASKGSDKPQDEQQAKQQAQAKQKQEMFDPSKLSPEQLQRLNQLVKKIPDNPSLLLKNKMAVEARKRQHERSVRKERKKW